MEYQSHPGPWGNIRGSYIYLEAPKVMVDTIPIPSLQPRWTYPAGRFPDLPLFLRQAGLDNALIRKLLDESRIVRDGAFIHLLPTVMEIESISRPTRAILYNDLAHYPQNEYHTDPLLIIGASVQEWYHSSRLRPALIDKIDQLSYPRNGIIAFSDIQALLCAAQSDTEVRQIFKAFTRTRSLMLRIVLDENTDVEQLIDYWSLGTGLRRKDIEPIILSIIESETLSDISLSHLLPPVARKLIFTYPGLDMGKYGSLPDCHWTSLNFFNYEPDQYVLDSAQATRQVMEQFAPVDPPHRYGDILLFLDDATSNAYHSCVFLADNLVFTKNGRNVLSPWVIMTLEDVKKIYLFRGSAHIRGFRSRAGIPSSPHP